MTSINGTGNLSLTNGTLGYGPGNLLSLNGSLTLGGTDYVALTGALSGSPSGTTYTLVSSSFPIVGFAQNDWLVDGLTTPGKSIPSELPAAEVS